VVPPIHKKKKAKMHKTSIIINTIYILYNCIIQNMNTCDGDLLKHCNFN